jgi:Tfp pilus assembly protein PilN
VCRELALGQEPRLNLLPPEWEQQRRSARLRRTLVRAGIVAGVLYVVGLILLVSLLAAQQAHLRRREAKIKELQPELAAARQLRGELLEMERQLDPRTSALEVLRELSVRLPDNVKLTGFDYKRDPDLKKDQTVTLRGQAQTTTAILDYVKALKTAGLFLNVETVGNMRTLPGGLTTFEVLCTFKTATAGGAAGHGAQ